jgi:hypothetical protein
VSERGEVAVVLPVERVPTPEENKDLIRTAFVEARKLVAGVAGKVLGVSKVARGVAEDGSLALKVTFAVDAPESTWHRRKVR